MQQRLITDRRVEELRDDAYHLPGQRVARACIGVEEGSQARIDVAARPWQLWEDDKISTASGKRSFGHANIADGAGGTTHNVLWCFHSGQSTTSALAVQLAATERILLNVATLTGSLCTLELDDRRLVGAAACAPDEAKLAMTDWCY